MEIHVSLLLLKFTIVDGRWSEWSITNCTKSCGTGEQLRQRYCNNPEPDNGGTTCQGKSFQSTLCNTHDCPLGNMKLINCSNPNSFNNHALEK